MCFGYTIFGITKNIRLKGKGVLKMSEKDNEKNDLLNSSKKLNDGMMELNDDIVSSVVGGMAEEYAAREKVELEDKLIKKRFYFNDGRSIH